MKKKRYKYMHLVDGQPGRFADTNDLQICHAGTTHFPVVLVDSLRQIRREQRLSAKFRADCGFTPSKYDYAKVALP